jgi:pilus assembly protein CpaC
VNRIAHVLALLLAVAVVLHASISGAAETGLVRLDVTIGRSQVVELKEPFTRVSVTNPAIADVFAVTPNQILINGKAVGVTSLVVFHNGRTLFFDVVVQNDTGLLGERLRQLAPRDDIQVTTAQDAIVLRGSVTNEAVIAAAGELAAAFAPKGKVVNLLALAEVKPQQVLLQVHVAEVAREALKELGFSIRALGSTLQGATFPGVPFFPPLGLLGPVTGAGFGQAVLGSGGGARGPEFQFSPPQGGSGFFLASGQRDVAGIVQALSSRNLLRTLAKPNLVTQSGKEAKFISGGEFPFPVGREFNSITIEFKEFGISLLFTPVVVDGQTINLRIRPEVSSLDFSQGLTVQGFNIPVIRKNQAMTTINLKDGESFAIAGLINNEVRQQVAKIPVLGDIPILGALFRSVAFQNNETELLFLVTTKLVAPSPAGTAMSPDPRALMELRPQEKKEFTLVPGIPGVGEVVDKPFGQSNFDSREKGK